jgi:FkbM family methyltransferase
MSILQGLRGYYNAFGVRGVLAISAHRLVGRPKEIKLKRPGIRYPVHIRVRTTDLSVYNDVVIRGEYSFDLPFSPKTIVDVGANTSNFAILVKNVVRYPNIFPIHAALWNKDGEIGISEPDSALGAQGKWGFFTHDGGDVRARSITMRTLMSEMNIDSIDLLKVDIEGAEKEVFEDCDWMQHVDCLIIELHDRLKPGCSAAVNTVTREFSALQRGEMTFYKRRR